jgi:hypothetical protein
LKPIRTHGLNCPKPGKLARCPVPAHDSNCERARNPMIERRAKAPVTMRRTLCAGFAVLLSSGQMSFAQTPIDIYAFFQKASELGGEGLARKTKTVDVRRAKPGEIVVTILKGEGKETQSPPAKAGDMVVRNRCPESGNEEFLVSASKFASRYDGPTGPAGQDGLAPVSAARRGYALRRGDGRGRRVHLHSALGRDDDRASGRCDRARRSGPEGHLQGSESRLHLHLRGNSVALEVMRIAARIESIGGFPNRLGSDSCFWPAKGAGVHGQILIR